MKPGKLLIFACCMVLVFASCQKEKNQFKYHGVIYDRETYMPIENATVSLLESKDFQDPSISPRVLQTMVTSANGSYAFEFNFSPRKKYRLQVNKPDGCYNYESYDLNTNKTGEQDLYILPETILYLHVKNQTPVDNFDRIAFAYSDTAQHWESRMYEGEHINDMVPHAVMKLNQKTYIKSFIYKAGVETIRLDSITPTTCGNATFDVFY